ncbi:hypothetical protein P8452_12904 [Trifolium repens]|nr:hypothetical protein P8452_12904 [Trifolium repens]
MSRNVSLENFECGSWASAAMSHEIDGDSNNSYFDLPLELMKYGAATDSNSPIDCSAASFCYEKEIKGDSDFRDDFDTVPFFLTLVALFRQVTCRVTNKLTAQLPIVLGDKPEDLKSFDEVLNIRGLCVLIWIKEFLGHRNGRLVGLVILVMLHLHQLAILVMLLNLRMKHG